MSDLREALKHIAEMDPNEWGAQGIWNARRIARAALAQPQNDAEAVSRFARHGVHLFETAKSLGWKDDGESPLNFIARHERQRGIETTPLPVPSSRMRKALERSITAIDDWLNVYASELCHEDRVTEANLRIRAAGGTLAYIAHVQRQNHEALRAGDKVGVPEPVYKAVERILDEKSAWVARPNDEVTKSIALQAVVAAHKVIAESCDICGGDNHASDECCDLAAEEPCVDCPARHAPGCLVSDETKPAVDKARQMLADGINIQATGEATNAIVTGIIKSLLEHIDELDADLKCAVAVGRMAARNLPSDDLGLPLERIRAEAARMGYALVPVAHTPTRIKNRIDSRLNSILCEMKPDYDDSICGFNEAWDIVRKVFDDALRGGE